MVCGSSPTTRASAPHVSTPSDSARASGAIPAASNCSSVTIPRARRNMLRRCPNPGAGDGASRCTATAGAGRRMISTRLDSTLGRHEHRRRHVADNTRGGPVHDLTDGIRRHRCPGPATMRSATSALHHRRHPTVDLRHVVEEIAREQRGARCTAGATKPARSTPHSANTSAHRRSWWHRRAPPRPPSGSTCSRSNGTSGPSIWIASTSAPTSSGATVGRCKNHRRSRRHDRPRAPRRAARCAAPCSGPRRSSARGSGGGGDRSGRAAPR